MIAFRRLTRRKQRDDAARAIDQLQVGDEIAQLSERLSRESSVVAFDDDQHVDIRSTGNRFVTSSYCWNSGVFGAEQLAERIIDLDAADAEGRENGGDRQDGSDEIGKAQGDEADTLDPVSQRMQFAPRAGRGWLLQERVQIFV